MNRRTFFASVVTVVGALKFWKRKRPFPDPAVNISVPMDWKQWEMPTNPPIRSMTPHPWAERIDKEIADRVYRQMFE